MSQRDYARLIAALKPHPVEHVLFAVLTYGRNAPNTLDAQYRELMTRWAALEQFLRRGLRREGFPGVGKFQYAAYVESHASGRPHVNVVIVSPGLAAWLRAHPQSASDRDVRASHRGKRAPRWFRTLARYAKFGHQVSLHHATSHQDAASYVTKFDKGAALTHPGLGGEVTKLSQLPVLAPRRFRRTRASRKFLPPPNFLVEKDPDITGGVLTHPTPKEQLRRQREAFQQLAEHLWPSTESASLARTT